MQQQLSRACLAEETMHQTLTLVTQHHGVMAENRQFRAQQYKQRADMDLEEALRRDNACLEQANQVRVRSVLPGPLCQWVGGWVGGWVG